MADQPRMHWTHGALGSIIRRRRVLLAGGVLLAMAWVAQSAWHYQQTALRQDASYRLTAEQLEIASMPPWVPKEIGPTAIARAEMQGPLSLLDSADLTPRLAEAFRLEPWVSQVRWIEVRPSGQVRVELDFRRPLAAVLVTGSNASAVFPVDDHGIRLPARGLDDAHLRRLPRITAVYNAPPEGEAWSDRRVLGAISLITALRNDWASLSLADVTPSARPEIRGEQQFYSYEVTTTGGTRIVWGAAPQSPAPDEPHFQQKLSRLKQYVAQHRVQLDGRRSPQSIDLRYGLAPTPRVAKEQGENRTAQKAESADQAELVK